jgi:NADPH:quinone reductase-like Zn-dependent oxidoreductase
MGGLSAWQALFLHGKLEAGQRVLIHGAAGGVGHLATQLARWRGAHVIGTATGEGVAAAREFGAHEVVDRATTDFVDAVDPVDLVFDTVGGETLARSAAVLKEGGRIVSVAEEPPEGLPGVYFVVEPDRDQLVELARLVDEGALRPAVDSVFALGDAAKAFERVMTRGKRGKVVLVPVR